MRAVNRRIARTSLGVVTGVSVAIAAIGWMHTRAGRIVLAKLGVPCPVNMVDSKTVLAIRDEAAAKSRGGLPAPQRPALGLQLEHSTKSEVATWAARNHVDCAAISRGFEFLRCRGVQAQALGLAGPDISELWFSFNPGGALVAINLYRRSMTPSETQQSWQAAVGRLEQALGQPMVASGDPTLARLFREPVAVARIQYAYSDYQATVTASHLPYGGLAVREQYISTSASSKPYSVLPKA